MYVTPPDTDVYSIPKVLAPMPQKVNSNNASFTMFLFNPYSIICYYKLVKIYKFVRK